MRLDHLLSKEETSRVAKSFGHRRLKKRMVKRVRMMQSINLVLFNFEGTEGKGFSSAGGVDVMRQRRRLLCRRGEPKIKGLIAQLVRALG